MKNALKYALGTTIAITAASMASAAAPSYDAKVFSGSLCQPHGGTQAKEISYPHGAVNTTSHYVWVSCPIVRDNTRNEDGTVGLDVRVRNQAAVDSGENLTCRLNSYSAGSYLQETDIGYLKPSAAQHGIIKLDLDQSGDGGFYTLLCHLPGYSMVLSYEMKEYLSTDEDS